MEKFIISFCFSDIQKKYNSNTAVMNEIKCLDNYSLLREMFLKGEKGDVEYFVSRLQISPRTFYRLIKYLDKVDGIKIEYNRFSKAYCL